VIRLWIVLVGPGLLPSAAFAAEEMQGAGSPLWHLANLILLVAIVVRFAKAPVKSFFAERRRTIEAEIGEARQQLRAAEERLERWQSRLAEVDREMEELRVTLRARAEAEAERILERARAAAERIRRDTAAAVESEARHAHDALRNEAVALAVKVADSLLREHIADADRERLVDDFVARVDQPRRRDGVQVGG
jgi:F0F1-type ATP synthase membrane subunit b/b'